MRTRVEVIADVLKVLELAALRPGAYMASSTNVDGFLAGIRLMARICGLEDVPIEICKLVEEERGWHLGWASCVHRQFFLAHTKLTDEEIAHELLTIELEAWRRTFGAELEEAGEA